MIQFKYSLLCHTLSHIIIAKRLFSALVNNTRIEKTQRRQWDVSQVLLDPAGDHLWAIHGEVDLRAERDPQGPLVAVRRIGP